MPQIESGSKCYKKKDKRFKKAFEIITKNHSQVVAMIQLLCHFGKSI